MNWSLRSSWTGIISPTSIPQAIALIQASSGSLYKRALVQTPKLDFAPRFGVSWQLDPKTVIRSAYGISFDQFNREGGENLLAYNGPYIINSSVNQVAPFAFTGTKQPLCTGDNYTVASAPSQQGYPANFVDAEQLQHAACANPLHPQGHPTGYVQAWHLDVQREIAQNTVLTVSYIGEHGVHIWVLADLNQAVAESRYWNAKRTGAPSHSHLHRHRRVDPCRLPHLQRSSGQARASLLRWPLSCSTPSHGLRRSTTLQATSILPTTTIRA